MEQYVKSVLGYDIILEKYDIPKNIPRYLIDGYSYNKYTIEGQDCLFVAPADFSLAGYKKHYEKIKQLTGMFPVLELKSITPYQRKALIEQHIPFVVQDYAISKLTTTFMSEFIYCCINLAMGSYGSFFALFLDYLSDGIYDQYIKLW